MIILAVVCVMLYVLGGMLAYSMCIMHIETEPDGERSSFRKPEMRIVAVLLWPWLAFHMLFDDADADVSQRGK